MPRVVFSNPSGVEFSYSALSYSTSWSHPPPAGRAVRLDQDADCESCAEHSWSFRVAEADGLGASGFPSAKEAQHSCSAAWTSSTAFA